MESALAWLRDQHGGAEGYLLAHGMRPDQLTALRTALLPGT